MGGVSSESNDHEKRGEIFCKDAIKSVWLWMLFLHRTRQHTRTKRQSCSFEISRFALSSFANSSFAISRFANFKLCKSQVMVVISWQGRTWASPGPGAYQAPSGHGVQSVSSRANPSAIGFPRAERFKQPSTSSTDAEVGSYNIRSTSCGPQINSGSSSAPKYGFGTSTRDGLQKVRLLPPTPPPPQPKPPPPTIQEGFLL
jgi:Sperm-tail PG-rich repeat